MAGKAGMFKNIPCDLNNSVNGQFVVYMWNKIFSIAVNVFDSTNSNLRIRWLLQLLQ